MKDEKSIAEVLGQIAKSYGEDIFLEQRRVYAILSDLASGDSNAKQRRRIKMSLEAGSVEILLKAKKDKKGAELYINESVSRLISNTDMDEGVARETINIISEALSISPSAVTDKGKNTKKPKKITDDAQTAKPQEKPDDNTEYGEGIKMPKFILIGLLVLCGAFAIFGLVALFMNLDWTGNQWFIGIGSGLVLAAASVGLSFLFENLIDNYKCQTLTVIIPILFVGNILLRCFFGEESVGIIFRILMAFIFAGSVANAVFTHIEQEEKYMPPNIIAAVLSALLFFIWPGDLSWTGNQWFIGIGSGLVLAAASVGLSFLFENLIDNYKCQTLTVIIPILFAGNILLRCFLGDESVGIIFRILMAFIFAGSVANAVFTHIEQEEKYMPPNIIAAVLSALLFFIWPGDFSWTVWQWIIGIGGGLVLCALAIFAVLILDEIGPETHQSLSVILILFTIANLVLLLILEQNYLIISMCFMVILAIGAIITAFISFSEASSGIGILNIILSLINGGIFLFITIGSYEQLMSYIQPLLDKIR